jgi:predicted nucleic acid-binding protein
MNAEHRHGLLDTNILVLRRWIDPGELPDEMAISAVTLAELSAGPHQVRRNDEQDSYDEHAERARRLDVLQRAENGSIPSRSAPRRLGSTAGSQRPSSAPEEARSGHRT